MKLNFATTLALATFSMAKQIEVHVGNGTLIPDRSLTFTPDEIKAEKGDTVVFHFLPDKNGAYHNVVEGDFNNACKPKEGGFYSGFINSAEAPHKLFTVQINDTNPIFLYCSQLNHCQQGMVAAINPQTTDDNCQSPQPICLSKPKPLRLTKYKEAARNSGSSSTPDMVRGGIITENANYTLPATPPSAAGRMTETSLVLGVLLILGLIANILSWL